MKCILALLIASALAGIAAPEDLVGFLPSDDLPPGWKAAGEHRMFEGKALYQHINGGSELFHKYGFQRLCLKDYSKKAAGKGLEIRVEIYDMGSAGGAADIFAANTLGIKTSAEFGDACTLDDMQIIFKRGQYYITVTGYKIDEEVKTAIKTLAGAVDANICGFTYKKQEGKAYRQNRFQDLLAVCNLEQRS